MSLLSTKPLSSAAVEVLGAQLFARGPTWDGNLVSKTGRDELVNAGLADRVNGFNFLTAEGVRVASEWDLRTLRQWHDKSWYIKASCQ